MKVSCIPICFFRDIIQTKTMSIEEWIKMASEIGLDGIEMYEPYLTSWEEDYIARLTDAVHDAGLEISMFTSYANFSSPDPAIRSEQISNVRRAVDAAVAFRTNIVRVTAGSWVEGLSRDEILSNVADGLRDCLDYAESRGVILALEDHPEVGTKIADFMRILELVDDDRLKVNLDTSNPMVSGEDAVDLAELVKDRVVHVHASDRDGDLEHAVVGEGVVNFPGIFKILKAAGFDGWISLEAGGSKGKEGIRQGMEYVRRVWASI
jgi:sugar phosphate isomerase/epimerase